MLRMVKNAYLHVFTKVLAKVGADTAENEQNISKFLKTIHDVTKFCRARPRGEKSRARGGERKNISTAENGPSKRFVPNPRVEK